MMATAKFSEVKVVLSARMGRTRSRRKATGEAQVAYWTAMRNFEQRATPATWARLVTASRHLCAIVTAERDEYLKRADAEDKVRASQGDAQ